MNNLISLLIFLSFLGAKVSAQNDSLYKPPFQKRNIIKFFYYGPNAGGYNLAFERMLRRKFSAQLAIRFIHYNSRDASYDSRNDFYLKPEVRYYLSKNGGPKGFYLGAVTYFEFLKVVYRFSPSNNAIDKEILNGFYLGEELHIGCQWLIKRIISVDINAGARYMNRIGPVEVVDYKNDDTVSKTLNYFDVSHGYFTPVNLLPSFLFTLGVAF
jgi:hypothetical protein